VITALEMKEKIKEILEVRILVDKYFDCKIS
jgi:hypothetical protein